MTCPNFRIGSCDTCSNLGCNIYTPPDCDNTELNVGLMRWSFTKNAGGSLGFDGSGTVAFHLDIIPRYVPNGSGSIFAHSNTCPASSLFVTPMTGLDMTLTGNNDNMYSGITSDFFLEMGSPKSLYVTLVKTPVDNVQGGPGFGAGDRWRQDCWTATMQGIASGTACYTAIKKYTGRTFIILPDGSESNISNPTQFFLRDSWNVPSSGFIGIFTNGEEVNSGPPTGAWECQACDPLNGQIVSFSCYDGVPYYWYNVPTYIATLAGFTGKISSCTDCNNLNGSYIFTQPVQNFAPFSPLYGNFGNTINVSSPCACNQGTTAASANFCTDGTCLSTSGCTDSIYLAYSETGTPEIKVVFSYTYYAGVVDDFTIGFGTQTCKYGNVQHTWSIPLASFNYYGNNTLNLEGTIVTPPIINPLLESWHCRSDTSGCVPPGSIQLNFMDWSR